MTTVQDVEATKRFILGNFSILPKDIILLLISTLPPQSALDLCVSNADFNQFCNKYKILENNARKYILEEAPLGEPLDTIFKQADAIKRGQTTYYTLNWDVYTNTKPQVVMGKVDQTEYFISVTRYFLIKGSPPPKGTKVYVFGMYDDEEEHWNQEAYVYMSLEDIIKSRDAYTYTLEDRLLHEPEYNFKDLREAINTIFKKGAHESFYLHQIELP